jgi:hypothetical protein
MMNSMSERVIKALAYPRFQLRGDLDLGDCPHGGLYDTQDPECLECNIGPECRWLYSNEEFAALQQKSLRDLIDALEFAIEYVDALVTEWEHKRHQCRCEACTWLRDAHRLFDEAQGA